VKRRITITAVLCLAVVAAATFIPSALGDRNILCTISNGTLSSSNGGWGATAWTYTDQTEYTSNHDYWAYRFDINNNVTWSHFQDVSQWGQGLYGPNPENVPDLLRKSEMNGTLGATYWIGQWTKVSC